MTSSRKKQFDIWLANKLGDWLGNMNFFYFCVILDLIELPPVIKAHDVIVWITYMAQTVVQLLALPILQVYQNLHSQNMQDLHDKMDKVHKHLGVK